MERTHGARFAGLAAVTAALLLACNGASEEPVSEKSEAEGPVAGEPTGEELGALAASPEPSAGVEIELLADGSIETPDGVLGASDWEVFLMGVAESHGRSERGVSDAVLSVRAGADVDFGHIRELMLSCCHSEVRINKYRFYLTEPDGSELPGVGYRIPSDFEPTDIDPYSAPGSIAVVSFPAEDPRMLCSVRELGDGEQLCATHQAVDECLAKFRSMNPEAKILLRVAGPYGTSEQADGDSKTMGDFARLLLLLPDHGADLECEVLYPLPVLRGAQGVVPPGPPTDPDARD